MSEYISANGDLNLDAISTGFSQVPLGVYNAVLQSCTMQEPKAAGKGETLVVAWRITDGPYANELLYVYYDFTVYQSEGKKPLIRGVGDILKDFEAAGKPFNPAKEVLSQSCTKNAKLFAAKLTGVGVRVTVTERAGKPNPVTKEVKNFRNTRVLEALPKKAAVVAPVATIVAAPVADVAAEGEYLD
jgi:hypothetical protein